MWLVTGKEDVQRPLASRLYFVATDRPGRLNRGMSMSLPVQRSWAEGGSLLTSLMMACDQHCTWVKY